MGGSVDVKSEVGHGTEFIINMRTKCKVKQTFHLENRTLKAGVSRRENSSFVYPDNPSVKTHVFVKMQGKKMKYLLKKTE